MERRFFLMCFILEILSAFYRHDPSQEPLISLIKFTYAINQLVWCRIEVDDQIDLCGGKTAEGTEAGTTVWLVPCGGQTAHRIEAVSLIGPLWRLDRRSNRGWWSDHPSSSGLKSSWFDDQLILIMLINCVIIISWLIRQLTLIQICINNLLINMLFNFLLIRNGFRFGGI
jgi:hypothetical protein